MSGASTPPSWAARYTELVEKYLAWLVHSRNRGERTAGLYRRALERLAMFAGDRDPLELQREELEVFGGVWLFKQGVGPRGRHPQVAAVRGFYRWCYQREILQRNPAASMEYPAPSHKIPHLITLENAERMMWAPDFNTFKGVRDGAILGLLMGCGLRVSGLVALNEGDVIEDVIDGQRRLHVRVTEKGRRQRLVPVPREAEMLLRIYIEHPALKALERDLPDGDRVLFVSLVNRACPPHLYLGERRRMSRKAVDLMVKAYGDELGIPPLQQHAHAYRHLYGTELAESEIDQQTRLDLMGHADPKSGKIYNHIAKRRLTRAVDQGNPLAKMRTPVSDLLKQLQKGT